MSARCMLSPVVNPTPNAQMPKAELYCTALQNVYALGTNGRFTLPWCLTLGFANDWTAADADLEIEWLFTVPAGVDSKDDLKAWLRSVTIGDMTTVQRNRVSAIFDNHAIVRADFTLQTTAFQIVGRILATLAASDMTPVPVNI